MIKGAFGLTRLYNEIIKEIPVSLGFLDQDLLRSTGHNLLGLAVRTTNKPYDAVVEEIKNYSAAVVPISSGQGVIPGFVDAVTAVLNHIGLKTLITRQLDVAGLGEAFSRRAHILFAADDQQFLAINVQNRVVVDNAWAAANGFVQALSAAAEMRAGGLGGQKVLVIGLGPVGTHAVQALQKLGAQVWVFDTDSIRLQTCVAEHRDVQITCDLQTAFHTIDYVLDATPAAGNIDESMIRTTTIVACPGVPHGLTPAALTKIGARFIHDNLPLGVAVMAVQSIGT